jgi:hypothetical protein
VDLGQNTLDRQHDADEDQGAATFRRSATMSSDFLKDRQPIHPGARPG